MSKDDQVYVTSRLGAASLVGVGVGLTSLAFAVAFGVGEAAVISLWLAGFSAALAWIQHRAYGGRR